MAELPTFPIGSPSEVAIAGVPQIRMRDRLEAACRVEARSEFVGECLILDEAARACRADPLLVESHGIDVATFDARDLGGHQGGAVLEILRTILCPYLELSMMRG